MNTIKGNPTRSLVRSSWKSVAFYRPKSSNDGWEDEGELPMKADEAVEPLPKVFDDEDVFVIKGRGWNARGRLTPSGFVVFKGSTVNAPCESFKAFKSYYPLRVNCEESGVIADGAFTCDCLFRSAAQAACVVAGAPVNARKSWTTEPDENGQTMTFGEAHPKIRRKAKKRSAEKERAMKRRRNEREAARAELREGVRIWRYSDGRTTTEWRGQMPFRLDGTYMGVSCAQ